jgi:hypothetical protein
VDIAEGLISPLQLANNVLTDAEKRSGCALIDLGADTTTLVVYKNNIVRYLVTIPLGSNNINKDLSTLPIDEAETEDVKLKYGDACQEFEASEESETQYYTTSDGRQIDVKSMHIYKDRVMTAYTARQNIIFRFVIGNEDKADKYRRNVSSIDYPSADTRGLSDFFPRISGGFELSDGTALLAVKKHEDEYPLRLFGTLSGRHTAWLIGRMENLCCVLEYNSIVHPELSADTIYINPYDHQASLYGGWWNAVPNNTSANGRIWTTRDNLTALRETAAKVLGFASASDACPTDDVPKPFADFLRSAPLSNAYEDFGYWDDVLIKSYGERKFINMETDDQQIYGKGK